MTHEVAARCAASEAMNGDWCLIDALRGGTRTMRAAGEEYLPKRPLEEYSDYHARLRSATLFPAFIETSQAMVGRVFADPMIVNDDVPDWIKTEVLDDVDKQGRNLHVFVREWFGEALDYGLSHVIVESPAASGVTTQADQAATGLRPYLIRIHPRDVLGWRFTDGKLTQLRVMFRREVEDGDFGVGIVYEIRVYEQTGVRVFVQDEKDWVEQAPIATTWDEIPLVTLYTKRTGNLTAIPPLRELAFLNAKHFRMQSANDTLIDTASVPILAITGVDSSDSVIIGAKHAVHLPMGATMEYVEHTGKAIEAGQAALDGLVEEMRQSGAKLLEKQTQSNKTATQVDEEAARDNSALGAMALDLQDTVNALLDVIASWRGEEDGGTVKVQPNLDPAIDPNLTMQTVQSMQMDSIVSPQMVFEVAKSVGILPDDADWETEQIRVKEQAALMPAPPVLTPTPKPTGAPTPTAPVKQLAA